MPYLAIDLIKLKVSIRVLKLFTTYHSVRRVREASSMLSIRQLRTKRKFSIKHSVSQYWMTAAAAVTVSSVDWFLSSIRIILDSVNALVGIDGCLV